MAENYQDKETIKKWLNHMGIVKYVIKDDLNVNVLGTVYLNSMNLLTLPIKFYEVHGDFICSNNHLTSLHNAPKEVHGMFDCSHNKLSSLEYAPQKMEVLDCSLNSIQIEKSLNIQFDYLFHYIEKEEEKIQLFDSHYEEMFMVTKGNKQINFGAKVSTKRWNEKMTVLKEKEHLESNIDLIISTSIKKLKV